MFWKITSGFKNVKTQDNFKMYLCYLQELDSN